MHVLSLALLVVAAQTAGSGEPKPPAAPAPPAAGAPLSPAVIEKMGQGDRAFLERDYRTALFAYLDATYAAPASAVPRVKLGRAYLAMRYPARAVEQAEKALALDPENADARKLLEEARSAAASAPPATSLPPPPQGKPAATAPGARVYRFVPDADASASGAGAAPASGGTPAPTGRAATAAMPRAETAASAPRAPGAPAPVVAAEPVRGPAPDATSATAAKPPGASAAQRYREGLDHLRDREFDKAIASLTDAVELDPRLAVAYAARASARFGLGAYREAADDYRTAIALDAKLATPLYGLAESLRALGQQKEAAEMYRRYAESQAPDVRDDLRALAVKRAQELR
jgi:tetratricopeptide (TPR) repeat protein